MALVDGFLELERSSGKLEWSAILQKMASDLGFSKILFGLLPKDSQDYENAFIVGNYPAAWREHYDRAGFRPGPGPGRHGPGDPLASRLRRTR